MKRHEIAVATVFVLVVLAVIIFWQPQQVIVVPTEKPVYYIVPQQDTRTPQPLLTAKTETHTTELWICTAYCSCEICCSKWALDRPQGIVYGAGGYELIQGKSMASALPFGTEVRITGADEYSGLYVCHDRPADFILERYDNKVIDIFFNNHQAAEIFGKRTVTVEILTK